MIAIIFFHNERSMGAVTIMLLPETMLLIASTHVAYILKCLQGKAL